MKGSIAVAVATGTLMVVAYGGFAMAVEAENPGDPVVAITATGEPEAASGEEASGDAPSPGAPDDAHGVVCVLVPIEAEPVETEPTETEPTETEPTETEPTETEPQTIEQLLAVNEIECSGTGNERSSQVALLPRYLAHSDEFSGADKGAAISAWAKTHANKKSADEGDEVPVEEDPADADPSTVDSSPGKSGAAPGQSGPRPGNGQGR